MSLILFITSEDFEQCKEVGILGPGSLVEGKGKKEKGEIGKITVSNRSKLSGGEDYHLACIVRPTVFFFFLFLLFFFFANTIFFLLISPNVEPGPRLRGWLCLQGSTAFGVSRGDGVYTKIVPDVLSVTIAYQFSSGIFEWLGWGGCVCVTGWVGMMLCYYVRLEQQAFSNYSIA